MVGMSGLFRVRPEKSIGPPNSSTIFTYAYMYFFTKLHGCYIIYCVTQWRNGGHGRMPSPLKYATSWFYCRRWSFSCHFIQLIRMFRGQPKSKQKNLTTRPFVHILRQRYFPTVGGNPIRDTPTQTLHPSWGKERNRQSAKSRRPIPIVLLMDFPVSYIPYNFDVIYNYFFIFSRFERQYLDRNTRRLVVTTW